VFVIAAYAAHRGHPKEFSEGIRRAVSQLLGAGERVVLVYPFPSASASVPRTLARYAAAGTALDSFTIDEADYLRKTCFAFQLLDSISDANVVHVLPHERLCDGTSCAVQVNGTPVYYDQQHLSVAGAQYLKPMFKPLFVAPPATAASSPAASPPRSRGNPAPRSAPFPSHRARGR
jgi:hypothetical protein